MNGAPNETVSSNSKFCNFLVRVLIQKDNVDNKVFKKEFYTKEIRKNGIEKIRCFKNFIVSVILSCRTYRLKLNTKTL